MKCLGLDIGSSSIKGAVLDLDRNELGSPVTRPFPAPISGLPAGWFEVSPSAVENQVEQVLEALLDAVPEAESLYCSGQMGGVILVDQAGEPLTNYLSWRDQRTLVECLPDASYLDAIRTRWPAHVLPSLGNELQPGSAMSLLFWLVAHERLPAQAIPSTIGDFVIGRRCGRPGRMHVTQAIGMLDLCTSEWHREAFELLGLSGIRLPELSHQVDPLGPFTVRGRALRVLGAYGDQQCALRGAGLTRDALSINVSTGSQVSRRTSRFEPGRYQTRRYFDGDWLNTVTHLPAGRSLNALVDVLSELAAAEGVTLKYTWDTIVRKASQISTTDLQVDLAFFKGPLGSSGAIRDITTENLTIGNLFYGAFKAMAENYAECAAWLDPARSWRSVVLSGGLTQAVPLLRRMIADRFPVPVRESHGDETLLGLFDIAQSAEGSV